ncbi:MAG: hypothetical protein PVG83_05075 [Acidimicrobiia bacterium]|jgi:hypothetical protein
MAHTHHQTVSEDQDTSTGEPKGTQPAFLAVLTDRLPDWPWIAGFIAVTLVVTLIGGAVSNGVDQLVRPSTPQKTEPAASATPTTVAPSATATPTTVAAEETTAETTPPAGPAVVELSAETIDFGSEGISGEFDLTNTGGQAAEWTAESSSEAIAFSAPGGPLPPGETVTLRVSLDRSLVTEGEISETITIRWADGETEITATATHVDNPIIHNPRANPDTVNVNGEGCSGTQTTVSARIRDTSELSSVVVRWSPDGSASRETPMNSVGNDMFEGVVGPFTSEQTASVKVLAVDEHGNAGGASIAVTVKACP